MIYLVTNQIVPDSPYYIVISVKKSLELLDSLKVVGLDTETMGFDPYTKPILMLQLGCSKFQVVIDLTTIDITFYRDYIQSDRLFLGWNIKFDLKFLYHHRIVPRNVYDGFLAEKLMWLGYPSGFHSMALKAAGEYYEGVEMDKTVRGKVMWAGLAEDVIVYAANDVKYLESIMNKQLAELEKRNLLTALDYENRSVLWVAYTEYCGVLLDPEKWLWKMELDNSTEAVFTKALNDWVVASCSGSKFAYHYLQVEGLEGNDLQKARSKMLGERDESHDIKGAKRGYYEAYKVPIEIKLPSNFIKKELEGDLFTGFAEAQCTINWSSPKQVIPLLKALGFNLLTKDKKTGEMKDSTEAKVIEPQKDKSTLAYLYIQYKGATKVTSTYGQNVLNQINKVSGRIHTNFNQLGCDTGRLSSGGKDKANKIDYLNFQNFPNDVETRACFVSSPNMKWISCDYSGQESRIIADITNDKALLDLFNTGSGDVHSLVAYMSYPNIIPRDTKVEDIKHLFHGQRQDAKGIEFAINYGGDANTIATNKGIPIKEAQKIYDNYMKGFIGMKLYQDNQRRFVMNNGYIILNQFSQHKAYIYDYDILMGIKRRINSEDWDWGTYRLYKPNANRLLPNQVLQQVYRKFADGADINTIPGVYRYVVKKAGKEEHKEVMVTLADVYFHPVKYFFNRKSASEKQAINYPCQGGVRALDKSHKFGEGCDANTEPSLIVILRRCND